MWQAFTTKDLIQWYQNTATQFLVPWVKELANTFKSAFPKDLKPYVSERGWQVESAFSYPDLAEIYAPGLPWTSDLGLNNGKYDSGSGKGDTSTAFIDAVVI